MTLILASTSATRIGLLKAAGVDFEALRPNVDERDVERPLAEAGASPAAIALHLAEAKALAISARQPDVLVIGADQVLDLDGERFVKPVDRADAIRHLERLSGRLHHLQTAVVLARGAEIVWRHVEAPRLTMRALDPTAIARYLDRAGEGILSAVGAYWIEGIGIQLFSAVEGDYFAILGLPMVPLLHELRRLGALPL